MSLRLLAVHAHPDDESSKGAGTYAYYLERGYEVMVVTCTGGEQGEILNQQVAADPAAQRDIGGYRRGEMALAQQLIGFQHRWLGYPDSGLPPEGTPVDPLSFAGLPTGPQVAALLRIVRDFKPHVLVTYNENGGYPHPDHIRCHEISYRAWELAGDPNAYPETGAPWKISKLYYDEIFNPARVVALSDWVQQYEPESAHAAYLAQMHERMADRPNHATTRINVAKHLEIRDAALRAHASQVEPEHQFFFLPNHIVRAAWPTEDFRLAASRVPTTTPETDLFAGITAQQIAAAATPAAAAPPAAAAVAAETAVAAPGAAPAQT